MKRLILLTVLFVMLSFAVSHASSISIDKVTCAWDTAGVVNILPNSPISFDIRYINNSGYDIAGITNGFRIWTTGGSSFTPISVEMLYPGFEDYFDLAFSIDIFSDGVGVDTIGIGGSKLVGSGLPDGFDDVVYRIKTGGIEYGETLCIDSSFYSPAGTWKWATTSGGDIFPDWSGQKCFKALDPGCMPPDFTNCTDTIKNSDCDFISYTFDALGQGSGVHYSIISGPGEINTSTGEWSYTIPHRENRTIDTLVISAWEDCPCINDLCTTILQLSANNTTTDLNNDCSSDISDLVLLVAYMFSGGTPPDPLMTADMNGDSEIDISDMVWLVDYMFNGGPPPVK